MAMQPKGFIIVLNFNGRDVIKRCLNSVFKLEYPNFEVVVVDNNSSDDSFGIARATFSRAHFIKNEENLGFSAGNNVGIKFALERQADYVFLLNNDTEVELDCLTRLVEVAEKIGKSAGILSPVIFKGDSREVWFSGGRINWLNMKTEHFGEIKTQEFYESGFISGCAMLVRREVFNSIGLLDEDYFLYWEDADFSFRAKKAGFTNYIVSSAWLYHFEKSENRLKNKTYWLVISGLVFFKKNTPWRLKPWIKSYVLARKIKNFLDVKFKRNEMAVVVRKAYKDFRHAQR